MARSHRPSRPSIRSLEWLFDRRPINLLVVFLALIAVGTVGYVAVEGLSTLDAVYQTVITLSTVGYDDLVTSTAGRLFNIVFLILGVGIFVVALSLLSAFVVEGRLREALERRRMERSIAGMKKHTIICGYGRFGQHVAEELEQSSVAFAVIEIDPVRVDLAEERGHPALVGDATEEENLVRAGLKVARGVISTLGSDAANVYVALTARELRPTVPIVAMALDPRAVSKLRRAGANYVVSPYTIGATTMARRIARPYLSRFLDSAGGLEVKLEEIEIHEGAALAGKRLMDSTLRQRYGVTVVAVVKGEAEDIHYNPAPDLRLEVGDVLVAVGSPEGLEGVAQACAKSPA